MSSDKSGAGYGSHGGEQAPEGQDGAKSADYEQGKQVDGIGPGSGSNDDEKFGKGDGKGKPDGS
jgi:hypothetical protein